MSYLTRRGRVQGCGGAAGVDKGIPTQPITEHGPFTGFCQRHRWSPRGSQYQTMLRADA